MAVDMTEAMVGVCMEGIKAQKPHMTNKELLKELRGRLKWAKKWQTQSGQ